MIKKIAAGTLMSALGIASFAVPALAANNISFNQSAALNHDINVINANSASVTNTVALSATTGSNTANGGFGGLGGDAGVVSSSGDANSANAGDGGAGGVGGTITTGDASVSVELDNSINDTEIDVSASTFPDLGSFWTDLSNVPDLASGNASVDQSIDLVARVNVTNENIAALDNVVVGSTDTGNNVADGSDGGAAGIAGTVEDSGEANSAESGSAGEGGAGGTITTGASDVASAMVNIINRHVLRINQ